MIIEDRVFQSVGIENIELGFETHRCQVAVGPTGMGKCLGFGTPVVRYDGKIVPVETIRPGDKLMGPDSKPRTVLSTCRGNGPLFRIDPVKGESWICNDEHVLTVVHTETGEIEDVPLSRWLSESKWYRHCRKQFSVGIDYESAAELPLDPYFFGLWIGDGSKSTGEHGLLKVAITKPDPEVEACVRATALAWGLDVRAENDEQRCVTWFINRGRDGKRTNRLLETLRDLVGPDVVVPSSYLTSSRHDRLQLMAGWLDTDGHLDNGCFEIVQKRKDHADAFCQLARSLGFRVTRVEKVVGGVIYHRMVVSGHLDEIPTRIPRKQASPRRQIKDALRTGFKAISIGAGDYYGFELDGDGRFLLGDFTVTHNTVVAARLIKMWMARRKRCLFLAHRKELIDQVSGKLDDFGVPHGVLMGRHARRRPEEPVQVASVKTIMAKRKCVSCKAMPELMLTCPVCHGKGKARARTPPPADYIVVDEAHRVLGDEYMQLLAHYPKAKLLAITATPWRLDGQGLGRLFTNMVVIANMRELIAGGYLLPLRLFGPPLDIDLSAVRVRRGDYDNDQLANVMRREKLIGNIVEHYQRLGQGERAVVFATNVPHSRDITRRFVEAGISAEHLDGTMEDDQRDGILKRLRDGTTRVVSNVDVLAEGWDLPSLYCVILARPTKSITRFLQTVGRPMRPFKGQTHALVLDHARCVHEHGRPEDFRAWSLEDRKEKGRPKGKSSGELVQCPKCGQYLSPMQPCDRCNPQLLQEAFKELEIDLVEYGPELVATERSVVDPKPEPRPRAHRTIAPCECGKTPKAKSFANYRLRLSCVCGKTTWTVDEIAAQQATEDERAQEWQRLQRLRDDKGFSPSWAVLEYRRTFGEPPPRSEEGVNYAF